MDKYFRKLLTSSICCLAVISSAVMAQGRQMPPANVNVAAIKHQQLSPVAWVSGTVVSRNNSQIAADVSGRLIYLVDLGAKVNKGDIIARLDDRPLKLQQEEAQANVANAKAELSFEKNEVARKKSLVEKKLIAEQSLEETIANYNKAKASLSAATARLHQIEQDLAYTQLKAPFTGIVAERLRNQGEFINSGNAIVRLVETANVEASLHAPLTAYRFLSETSLLSVKSPLGAGQAPIKAIIPVADTRSHLMEVRLDMSALDWPIGLDIKAAVATGETETVLAIPRDALVLRPNSITIFVISEENKARQVNVSVGITQGELVQVIGDVKEGDLVVIRGAERLQPGQAVAIKNNNDALVSGNKTVSN